MKTLHTLRILLCVIFLLVASAIAQADCATATVTFDYDYSQIPGVTVACTGGIGTNCFQKFVVTDSIGSGLFPVPITLLPIPLGNVTGIVAGPFKATHKAGDIITFQVAVIVLDALGLPNQSVWDISPPVTCGAVPPAPLVVNPPTNAKSKIS